MLAFVAAAIVAIHPLPGLRTPSDNISCFVTPGPPAALHCSLKQADYAHYMQTVRCGPPIGLDWAGFTLYAYKKAQVILARDLPVFPMWQTALVNVASKKVQGPWSWSTGYDYWEDVWLEG